jgi:hypothetical protein
LHDDATVLLGHRRHGRRVVGEGKVVLGVQKRVHEMKQGFFLAAPIVSDVVMMMMMMVVAFVISPGVY